MGDDAGAMDEERERERERTRERERERERERVVRVIMGADEVCGSGVFTCHVYDDALIIFQRAWMWTRQPERLEDVCAACTLLLWGR